jgi:copper transport protein
VGAGTVSLDALLLSTYGRLVLLKVGALLGAVSVATVLTATLHPTLVPTRWRGVLRHRRWLLPAEALLLVAALALGATAAGARPAVGTEWTPTSAAPPLLSQEVEDLVETVKVGPNVPGRNFVTVDVFETRRPSPGPVTGVDVTVRGGDGRTEVVPLKAQGSGTWLAASDAFDEPGAWDVTVVAHRDGLPDATAGYAWLVADPSARLAAPLVSSAPYQGLLDGLAGIAAGAGLALLAGLLVARRRGRGTGRGPGQSPPGTGVVPPEQHSVADEVAAR